MILIISFFLLCGYALGLLLGVIYIPYIQGIAIAKSVLPICLYALSALVFYVLTYGAYRFFSWILGSFGLGGDTIFTHSWAISAYALSILLSILTIVYTSGFR